MKVINEVSSANTYEKLTHQAESKFVANETASSCLCRCSDG